MNIAVLLEVVKGLPKLPGEIFLISPNLIPARRFTHTPPPIPWPVRGFYRLSKPGQPTPNKDFFPRQLMTPGNPEKQAASTQRTTYRCGFSAAASRLSTLLGRVRRSGVAVVVPPSRRQVSRKRRNYEQEPLPRGGGFCYGTGYSIGVGFSTSFYQER